MSQNTSKGVSLSTLVILGGIAVAIEAAVQLTRQADTSTDITTGHPSDVLAVGVCVGLATAGIVFILAIWRSSAIPDAMPAPLLALVCGFMVGLLSMSMANQILRFTGLRGPTARYEKQFPIAKAYVTVGRNRDYRIRLADPVVGFRLSKDEYDRIFGPGWEGEPAGYCLWASVEQNGPAMRVMVPSGKPIPPGHVRPCPGAAGDSPK
ncbi:MAG: hypothetical protein JSR98_08730 [Proteobacteria bacterium]|nr:hypothetical protein [Pseudomonadota bacterium]